MNIHEDNNGVTTIHLSENNPGHDYSIGFGESCAFWEMVEFNFQNGAVKENGVNGITSESLLAVLIHRTEQLNKRFSCEENAEAIKHLKKALYFFESRTKNRILRGVEGKEVK